MVALFVVTAWSSISVQAQPEVARVVDSKDDRERLLGWDEHVQEQKELDRERLTDVEAAKKDRAAWEKTQQKSLAEHKVQKSKQRASFSDSGPEYLDDLKHKKQQEREFEKRRADYVEKRRIEREKSRAVVQLSEMKELGLEKNPDRVDWAKRDVLSEKSKNKTPSVGSSRPNSGGRDGSRGNSDYIPPEFDAPPPPTAAPPEFFEPDMPPPPPPLPPDGNDGNINPPSEDGAPPPVFDDEF